MLVAGVDGGGTKTVAVVVEKESLTVVGVGISGPSNYHNVGLEKAVKNIVDAVYEASGGRRVAVLVAGLAAIDTRRDWENVYGALSRSGVADKVVVESDQYTTLFAATLGKKGVIVISGTGSVAFGVDDQGRRYKAGNFGYLIGDEGSAYWIGQLAIRHTLKFMDGRRKVGEALAKRIMEVLNVRTPEDLNDKAYVEGLSVEDIAALAKHVNEVAEKCGDEVAQSILRAAGAELALACVAVLERMGAKDEEVGVYCSGSVWNSRYVYETFEKAVKMFNPRAKVSKLPYLPVVGSLMIALKEAGVKITPEMRNLFDKEIREKLAKMPTYVKVHR